MDCRAAAEEWRGVAGAVRVLLALGSWLSGVRGRVSEYQSLSVLEGEATPNASRRVADGLDSRTAAGDAREHDHRNKRMIVLASIFIPYHRGRCAAVPQGRLTIAQHFSAGLS